MATCGGHPRMQRRAIELHDTKVLWGRAEGRTLRIRLDAYVHVSSGEPGVDPGTGWSQEVDVVVQNASIVAVPSETSLWITRGSVEVEGCLQDGLPLPLGASGAIRIEWTGAEGRLAVRATGHFFIPSQDDGFVE